MIKFFDKYVAVEYDDKVKDDINSYKNDQKKKQKKKDGESDEIIKMMPNSVKDKVSFKTQS